VTPNIASGTFVPLMMPIWTAKTRRHLLGGIKPSPTDTRPLVFLPYLAVVHQNSCHQSTKKRPSGWEKKDQSYSGVHIYQDWTASTKASAARESRLPDQLWALSWASVSLISSLYTVVLVVVNIWCMSRDPCQSQNQRARCRQQALAQRHQCKALQALQRREADFLLAVEQEKVRLGNPCKSVCLVLKEYNKNAPPGYVWVSACLFGERGFLTPVLQT
jgi:hypothetical protein